jgi:hypothetical protein
MKILKLLILFSLFIVQFELIAQEKDFVIRWKEVSGNKGYVVKIKSDYFQKDLATETNSANLSLKPGKYFIQVAAKNRFGKPGKFSDSKEIMIHKDSNKEIDLAQDKSIEQISPETMVGFSNYQSWIPGYIQYKKENWMDASLYWIAMPSLAYIGYSEKLRGDRIASDVWNDPVNLYFLLQNRSPLEVFYFRDRRETEKLKYDTAQINQKYIGAGLFLFYAIHWADLYFFNGEGIIKSFSSSNREQANMGFDHITGIEFQWRFNTNQ